MTGAYYNEHDPKAAAVLRELISCGLIAPGTVDERSITEIDAHDLLGFTQCHFFAGCGIWSLAFRRGGLPDDRPAGSGSCPCQPFSAAGKGLGFDDPRHLWPAWLRLIAAAREQGQPWTDLLFGEQAPTAGAWLDLVSADLEALGYAFGAPDLPAAGFGGAHIRQRLYWVADAHDAERWADLAPRHLGDWPATGRVQGHGQSGAGGEARWLADADGGKSWDGDLQRGGKHGQQPSYGGSAGGPVHPKGIGGGPGFRQAGSLLDGLEPTNSGAACDWISCRDGRWRPVESGTFPLAHEDTARLGRLRLYGNALDAEVAANFVSAYLDATLQLDAPLSGRNPLVTAIGNSGSPHESEAA